MIRAVIDTNVLISGLLSAGGAPRQLINAWPNNLFIMMASSETVIEVLRVLEYPKIRSRIRISEQAITDFRFALVTLTKRTPGKLILSGVSRDPHDDMFVVCAVEGNADYIVSRDLDLLSLGSYQNISIISPDQFMEILKAGQVKN